MPFMRSLRRSVGVRQSIRQHAAEALQEFLLLAARQILPPGFGPRRRVQARGGAEVGRFDMIRILRNERDAPDTNGPVRATPTGMRSPKRVIPPRQRMRREEVSVGSVFRLAKKLSMGALSQQLPRRLMLHAIPWAPSRPW